MGFMDSFLGPGLFVKLSLDKTGFDTGLAKTKVDLVNWRNETNASSGEMLKWGAAIGSTVAPLLAVGVAANALIQKYGSLAQELKDLSYNTGTSTEKLQQLQYAAVLTGTSFDKVTFALGQLNLKMAEAGDKTSEAYKSFYSIGVNPEGKTPDQVFEAVALALSHIESPTERARIANELLGKSWKEMLPYMKEYIEKKDEIARNPTFTEEDLDSLENMKSGVDDLTKRLEVLVGKGLSRVKQYFEMWEQFNPAKPVDAIEKITQAVDEMSPPLKKSSDSLEELGKKAEETRRKIRDLALDLQEAFLGMREDAATTATLEEEKITLTTELKGLDPARYGDTAELAKTAARKKEIEERLKEIDLELEKSSLSQQRGMNDLLDTQTDLTAATIESDQKILASLQTRVVETATQYDALDQLELEHWTIQAELARVSYQAIADYAAETVNFAGSNPIIQKVVQLSASGYDIDPSPLPTVISPVLAAADFSGVLTKTPQATPAQPNTGGPAAAGGNTTTINFTQNNTGVPSDAKALDKSLGKLASLAGAGGR